jgi:hypothetical protein
MLDLVEHIWQPTTPVIPSISASPRLHSGRSLSVGIVVPDRDDAISGALALMLGAWCLVHPARSPCVLPCNVHLQGSDHAETAVERAGSVNDQVRNAVM